MNTYERIRTAAKLRGISLRELSKKVGFKSENAIYRYNQGINPRKSTLQAIANTLNVSMDYLEGKTDEIKRPKINPKVKGLARKLNDLDDKNLDLISQLIDKLSNEEDNE